MRDRFPGPDREARRSRFPYHEGMGQLAVPAFGTPAIAEISSGPTADEVQRCLADWPHLLFLDSAAPGESGRYSYVTADPFRWLEADAAPGKTNPWDLLAERLGAYSAPTLPDLPPFQGGAAGLLGYELAGCLERLPRPLFRDLPVPDLAVGFYDWVVAFDHQREKAWVISTGWPETEPSRRGRRARQRLEQVLSRLDRPPTPRNWQPQPPGAIAAPRHAVPGRPGFESNFDERGYLEAIGRAVEYVHAGDCFQVNVAQRLLTPTRRPPWETYALLRERNPAPFAAYFDLGDYTLASASPERFLRLQDGLVETRPIKGTRPRSDDPKADRERAEELRHSPKDRAENTMIVDLLRNDLGRVCAYGSIRVEALCRLESFRFVHHLVSEVQGRLRPGLGPVDLLRATFPGGSITGAPKIRAMEIITELERLVRGPYCGCLGWIGFDGAMDTNLLIRTLVMGRGWTSFSVGGGIVADSDPRREYEETWHKAAGLLRALEE